MTVFYTAALCWHYHKIFANLGMSVATALTLRQKASFPSIDITSLELVSRSLNCSNRSDLKLILTVITVERRFACFL